MIQITSRGKIYDIPADINELTAEQADTFLTLAMLHDSRWITREGFRRLWLSALIEMEDYSILLPEYIKELEDQQPKLDGFFMPDGSADLRTSKNILPAYEGLQGPADNLAGLSFGDFIEALTVLADIGDDNPYHAANHIARMLYNIPEEIPVPVLLAYWAPRLVANVWSMIQTGPVEINGAAIDFRIIFRSNETESHADDKTGWTGILFEIAEKGLFGPVPEVEKTDMWAILLYLYKCKFEYNQEIAKK